MKEKTEIRKIEREQPMNIGWKSARVFIAAVLLGTCCAFQSLANVAPAAQASPNGAAGEMPAYYDGELFTINSFEVPASDPLIGHNSALNIIYATNDLDEEQDFPPVLNVIQGDGFNPLWRQVLIVFNSGFTAHAFVSDTEVEAAAAGANPEITLLVTDEVYRCSVVGGK
jgi:hypothetical protein